MRKKKGEKEEKKKKRIKGNRIMGITKPKSAIATTTDNAQ